MNAVDGVLPNIVFIGGMKCGTSSLFRYLKQHPQVFVPRKNIEFFSVDHLWNRGAVPLSEAGMVSQ